MEIQKEYIPIPKQGRVYTLGNRSAPEVWIVFHGYGQLAAYFIRKFQCILKENIQIIAPEALSRFYIDEKYERVGACWMTKDDRLLDIHEQQLFLDAVYQKYIPKPPSKLILLGFSQGVPTLWRWMKNAKIIADEVILWAGSLPTEPEYLTPIHGNLWYVTGNQDPYLPHINIESIEEQAKKLTPKFEKITFEGKHTIPPEPLTALAEKLAFK